MGKNSCEKTCTQIQIVGCKKRAIKKVPTTITEPGYYYLKKDLTYNGTTAAITVSTSNVTINFCSHTLFLTNQVPFGTNFIAGIFVNGASNNFLHNIKILNPTIIGSNSNISTVGVWYQFATNVLIEDGYFKHHTIGVFHFPAIHSTVKRSRFEINFGDDSNTSPDATLRGVCNCQASNDVLIENCSFQGQAHTIEYSLLGIECTNFIANNINIRDCFIQTVDIGISALQGEGLLIEACEIRDLLEFSTGIALGSSIQPGMPTNNYNRVIIRNTNITSPFNAISALSGNNCLIENCNLFVSLGSQGSNNHAIQVGQVTPFGFTTYNSVTIRNANISSGDNSIAILSGSAILVENTTIIQTDPGASFFSIQLGSILNENALAKNVIMKNITINAEQASASFLPINLINGDTATLDTINIKSNSSASGIPSFGAAITIASITGGPPFFTQTSFNHVLLKNLNISGGNFYGIYLNGIIDVRIEDSIISDAFEDIHAENCVNVTIKNNDIQGPTTVGTPGSSNGINFIGTTCSSIINNEIRNNALNGIILDPMTTMVLVRNNDLYCNGTNITDIGSGNFVAPQGIGNNYPA